MPLDYKLQWAQRGGWKSRDYMGNSTLVPGRGLGAAATGHSQTLVASACCITGQ